MKIIIEAPFTVSEEMDRNVNEKLSSLVKYENKITQATVFFKIAESVSPHTVISEIRLRVPGKDLFASVSAEDSTSAFNLAANQIKTQLLKRKDIKQEHR